MISFRLFAPMALAVLVTTAAPHREADTVVLVVRHAEKAGPNGDVPLSADGQARARALMPIAREAAVSAIITTQFQRTRMTAAPTAQALGIRGEVIEAGGAIPDHAKAIADAIRGRFAGRSVLVVGHSNTVPAIVHALGGPELPDICDDYYDDLFTVIMAADGTARLVHAKYGMPSPTSATCAAMK